MKPWEQRLLLEKEFEEKQFREIIDKPILTAEELWSLTEDNFYQWRRKYDYPKLLNSFNEKIPAFLEWKKEFALTDEIIMQYRVSSFVEPKLGAKDRFLYLLEQTYNNKKRILVSHRDLTKIESSQLDVGESYVFIKKFISYADWCKNKKIEFNLFNVNQRQAPNHPSERVWLDTGYELLKMGGIEAPVNAFGILLRGKYLDFVNLCGLELKGEIYFGTMGNLEVSYSALDNLRCNALKMPLLNLWHCSINNIDIFNSELQSWRMWECEVTGDITSSKLRNSVIYGGWFDPLFRDTSFSGVHAIHKGYKHVNFSNTYISFKKIYADQGDDENAIRYFINEKEMLRQYSTGWQYLKNTINYYFWGYGRKPINVVYSGLGAIIFFGFVYFIFREAIKPIEETKSLMDCMYFSTVTFTTLGYGDFLPLGGLRVIAMIESFFGPLMLGFLVAGYSNTKY